LSDAVALSLTVVDWPGGPRVLPDLNAEWLVGANMAAPRHVLEELGGFHPWLDRAGTHMLSSGDVFLEQEAVRHGYVCVYEPAALVHHVVPAERLEQKWFRRRFLWQGVSNAVMEIIEDRPSPGRRLARAAGLAARLARAPRRLARLARETRDAAAFEQQCWTLVELGQIAGLLGAAKR
jgi:GT2 family glycosyltransferase